MNRKEKRAVWSKPPGPNQPIYVVKLLVEHYKGRYYSSQHAWTGVPIHLAERMTKKQAERVRGHLVGCRIVSEVELLTK